MKILTINGSHRKKGNTGAVLTLLAEALEEKFKGTEAWAVGRASKKEEAGEEPISVNDLTIEHCFLSDLELKPCRGCRVCFDRGEASCPVEDGLLSLHKRILEADCVILATPVYVNDVSSTMKTMIDRLAFVCHRPAYWNTPMFLIATTGGSPTRHTIRTLQSAAISWGVPLIGSLGLTTGALSTLDQIRSEYNDRIMRKARIIASYLHNERHKSPGFISLTVFAIQQYSWSKLFDREETESVDARYWKERSWTGKDCFFFFPPHVSGVKSAAARLIGKLAARIVT